MGQSWGTPQYIDKVLSQHIGFLNPEVEARLNAKGCKHLRSLTYYGIEKSSETRNGNELEKLRFDCQPDFTKLKSIEELNAKDKINYNDYQDIFSQLILGLYEMHKNNFMGRCISQSFICYERKNLTYGLFGYFHPIEQQQFAPENLYKLTITYETDYWQIAKIMWQLYNRCKDCYDKNMRNLAEEVLKYNIKEIKINQEQTQPQPIQLVNLINEMLPIYCGQRISIINLLQNDFLNLNDKRGEMIEFYKNYEFGKYFTNLMQNNLKRDENKFLIYQIDLQNRICREEFAQEIIQILLIFVALQLVFHYPTKNSYNYPILLSTIYKLLILYSKKLKDKLILSEKQLQQSREYLDFKSEIIKNHEQLVRYGRFTKGYSQDYGKLQNLKEEEKIQILHFKLYQFRAQADKPQSIPQTVLLNILGNLKQKNLILKKEVNLEQQFIDYLNKIKR